MGKSSSSSYVPSWVLDDDDNVDVNTGISSGGGSGKPSSSSSSFIPSWVLDDDNDNDVVANVVTPGSARPSSTKTPTSWFIEDDDDYANNNTGRNRFHGNQSSSSSSAGEFSTFVNENMRGVQDGLSRQPKRNTGPLTQKEMSNRRKERQEDYERRKRIRSARINNISQQWAASHMANSSSAGDRRRGSFAMRGGQVVEDDTYAFQNCWTCCGLFH